MIISTKRGTPQEEIKKIIDSRFRLFSWQPTWEALRFFEKIETWNTIDHQA